MKNKKENKKNVNILNVRDIAMIPLNWKLSLPPGHRLLMPLDQQAEKRVTVLAGEWS